MPSKDGAHGVCQWCAWSWLDLGMDDDKGIMKLPGLQIVSELARGGMGVVYRAIEAEAGRDVAVKMMQPTLSDDAEVRERFAQEARAMGAMDHSGILPVYRVGDHHGLPYFTMKLAEGGTLAQRRARLANDWQGIAMLMMHLADAVHHAHQRGLLHRDLKPQNVLFDGDGRAYVSDFGLVKMAGVDSSLTRSVSLLGTPHYMAPEVAQRDARAASVASDVWSLGAILYELLAQQLAFQAEGVPALLRKIVDEDPPPLLSVPRDLATITLKCLRKEPAQRYASAKELGDDLQRWLRGEPISARQVGAAERFAGWCRRKPALATTGALFVLTVLASVGLMMLKNRQLSHALTQSQSHLFASLLNEARSVRLSARVQDRDHALEAIQSAAAIGSTPELEREAASVLALPSVTPDFMTPAHDLAWKLIPDRELRNAADYSDPEHVRIIDLRTRSTLATLPGGRPEHTDRHAFSADGELLLVKHPKARSLIIYEWRTGKALWTLDIGLRPWLVFSNAGRRIAYAAAPEVIRVVDLDHLEKSPRDYAVTGFQLPALLGFDDTNEHLLVSAAEEPGQLVLLLSLETGDIVGRKDIGQMEVETVVAFDRGSGFMVGSGQGTVAIGTFAKAISVRQFPKHVRPITSLAMSSRAQLAVTSGKDERCHLIDWPSGRLVGKEAGSSLLMRFSPDGHRLVMNDTYLDQLRFFKVAPSEVCHQFVHPDALGGGVNPDGSWCTELRPDGRLLAVAEIDGVHLYDGSSSDHLAVLPAGSVHTLYWSSDGRRLWVGNGWAMQCWAIEDGDGSSIHARRLHELPLNGGAALRFSIAEDACLWSVCGRKGVFIGGTKTKDIRRIDPPHMNGSAMEIDPQAISPDGRWLAASAIREDQLFICNTKTGEWLPPLPVMKWACPQFSADGKSLWVLTALKLQRFECGTWKLMSEESAFEYATLIRFARVTGRSPVMATSDSDVIVLRNSVSGAEFLRLRHPLASPTLWLAATPDGRYVLLSCGGHIVQVWDLAKLQHEFAKLGLTWRGPDFNDAANPVPVSRIVIE
ncbi:MAG: WD40 repeat domain-containing serine/threonine protein kinase [Verrucomicrobiota bacterium]